MSKFTKYLNRAVSSSKPEKESGVVGAVTREGYFMCQIVGDPKIAAQVLMHGADLDVDIEEFITYICDNYNKRSYELQHEQEDKGVNRQTPEEERRVPGEDRLRHKLQDEEGGDQQVL